MQRQTLSHWSWREAPQPKQDGPAWTDSKPERQATQLHLDLQDAGLIPDPFIGRNASLPQVQAPSLNPLGYQYRACFELDHEALRKAMHVLVFEGLDTLAEVHLNGTHILSSDNMFQSHRLYLDNSLLKARNELLIHFSSTLLKGRELEAQHGKLNCWNGEPARLYIRQAQHQWGWDWQPTLITCGPYRPIHVESYDAALRDVHVHYELNPSLTEAKVTVDLALDAPTQFQPLTINLRITAPGSAELHRASCQLHGGKRGHFSTTITSPQLWWPWRFGAQHLYTIELSLCGSDSALHHRFEQKIGFRRARLVQEPFIDQPGTSFYFEINNEPIFACGTNWIPAHAFEAALTAADFKRWIELARSGNQDMLRVWGGGNFMPESFYEECDRNGILVWQDFMFACGQYPCFSDFEESVKIEATQQLKRLRRYPCVVLLAGNNEDYQVAESLNLTWNVEDISGDYRKTDFPARTLYETLLPALVKKLTSVDYHPGSPWGGKHTRDLTVGDHHAWDVWHGSQKPYQSGYDESAGRFISEFGMQGLPVMKTINGFIEGSSGELHVQSRTFEYHNNADSWERRLALYLFENVRLDSMTLEDWSYTSQLMQAEAFAFAYRAFRRGWRGPYRRHTGGALAWQLNDAWPCVSWSVVDFHMRPKLAFYAIKRESQDLCVVISRATTSDLGVDVSVANSGLITIDAQLELYWIDVSTAQILDQACFNVTSAADSCEQVFYTQKALDASSTVLQARLVRDGRLLHNTFDWPQPLKHLQHSEATVKSTVLDGKLELSTESLAKGVQLTCESDALLSDNGFDLSHVDGTVTIEVSGLHAGDVVNVRWLGKETV